MQTLNGCSVAARAAVRTSAMCSWQSPCAEATKDSCQPIAALAGRGPPLQRLLPFSEPITKTYCRPKADARGRQFQGKPRRARAA